MPDLKKLDWLASWQNALAFVVGVAATLWLGPWKHDEKPHALLVFLVALALTRLILTIIEATAKLFRRKDASPTNTTPD